MSLGLGRGRMELIPPHPYTHENNVEEEKDLSRQQNLGCVW